MGGQLEGPADAVAQVICVTARDVRSWDSHLLANDILSTMDVMCQQYMGNGLTHVDT